MTLVVNRHDSLVTETEPPGEQAAHEIGSGEMGVDDGESFPPHEHRERPPTPRVPPGDFSEIVQSDPQRAEFVHQRARVTCQLAKVREMDAPAALEKPAQRCSRCISQPPTQQP